uniref:Uncharacterized protein n=1 Tax=Grammatophora oceanica TaxID=210454 RepID=A0A7S1V0K0_9STRA|mmetsp:Transcript_32527/g.48238  ORF Transcript_32527/g.48238 Transcript_32527/m.48238 type:complete len:166 (+) Transcript_32527:80-577(+)|eukprot:CAMPEP_0194046706 /NCGR_PEP_ID=MMETSP0009_2-20130614/22255_1 /TAXON_ID=210454 /ORGANISM="Grammatophora oceanica, Strain CCMP 410" /LENGTH=165 /DNA_ID=CAMNT_0038692105 /DNA_START=52 /DNA_END=549 /DNA_ORIENTATION=-
MLGQHLCLSAAKLPPLRHVCLGSSCAVSSFSRATAFSAAARRYHHGSCQTARSSIRQRLKSPHTTPLQQPASVQPKRLLSGSAKAATATAPDGGDNKEDKEDGNAGLWAFAMFFALMAANVFTIWQEHGAKKDKRARDLQILLEQAPGSQNQQMVQPRKDRQSTI